MSARPDIRANAAAVKASMKPTPKLAPWAAVAKNFRAVFARLEALERKAADKSKRAIASTRVDAYSRLVIIYDDGTREIAGRLNSGAER